MFQDFVMRPSWRRKAFVARPVAALMLAAALSACGGAHNPEQLIVKGDKFEVTLQEFDQLLRRLPPVTKDAVGPLRRALLQQLIDEKLLAEAATKAGLENDPASAQAIAAAKRNILAQAYVHSLTGNIPKPTNEAVDRYYASHPAMFANRRRFVVEEYVLASDLPDIRNYLDTLDKRDFATLSALIGNAIPSLHAATVTRFSDELPDNAGGALDKLTVGSNIVYQSPGQVHLGRVLSVAVEPVSIEAARPRIEQSLMTERAAEITSAAVKALRNARHVEILNANLRSAAAPVPATPATAPVKS